MHWAGCGLERGAILSIAGDLETCTAQDEVKPGSCCFAAGTPVHTDHGDVPIENIHEGDEVESRNRATGKLEYQRVTALTPLHENSLVEMHVEGERTPLRPAIDHPFWVRRGAEVPRWIEAADMRTGDFVQSIAGAWRRVVSITPLDGQQTVYNFTVDLNHDYFVGETGFLVHNAGGCGCGPGNPPSWITPGSLPPDEENLLLDTLSNLDNGTIPAGPTGVKWGAPFKNWSGFLPGGQGPGSPFQEYQVGSGGLGAGTRRVVHNPASGEAYYTLTHYGDTRCPPFVRIR